MPAKVADRDRSVSAALRNRRGLTSFGGGWGVWPVGACETLLNRMDAAICTASMTIREILIHSLVINLL
jgi:hypothetical protein